MNAQEFLAKVGSAIADLPEEIEAHLMSREEGAALLGKLKTLADEVVKVAPLFGPEGAAIAGAVSAAESVAGKLIPDLETAADDAKAAISDVGEKKTSSSTAVASIAALLVAGATLLSACTAQQAQLAQQDACWIQSAANAAGALAGTTTDVGAAASVLSKAAGVECTSPVPAQAPAAAPTA